MGQAKLRQRAAFALHLIDEWEADDCVNFAVALARLTGWLLHVDWWSVSTSHQEDIPLDQLRPLRVYVADNRDGIFDVRGVRRIVDFNERVIVPIARSLGTGAGGVYTRFYSEERLAGLPLRSWPDEAKIAKAEAAIRANESFLASIPARTARCIPAHEAARFTYGRCAPYAEAMLGSTGLQPVALQAVRFSPQFEGTRRSASGYFHSVVLHPDGTAEDSWGRASLADIASRFGVIEFRTSVEEHQAVVAKIRQASPEQYERALQDALALISKHRQP